MRKVLVPPVVPHRGLRQVEGKGQRKVGHPLALDVFVLLKSIPSFLEDIGAPKIFEL